MVFVPFERAPLDGCVVTGCYPWSGFLLWDVMALGV